MKDGHINEVYEALNFLKVEGHILSLQVQKIVLYLKVKQPESDSQFGHSTTTRVTFLTSY